MKGMPKVLKPVFPAEEPITLGLCSHCWQYRRIAKVHRLCGDCYWPVKAYRRAS